MKNEIRDYITILREMEQRNREVIKEHSNGLIINSSYIAGLHQGYADAYNLVCNRLEYILKGGE